VEYRNLGNSGLHVSAVGLGCNNFGMRLDAEARRPSSTSASTWASPSDTADVYGGRGKSEAFLAPALKPHRRNIVIATKSASPMGEGPYWRGASRRYLMDAVDDCLRRLDTDYIDLYQIHFPDTSTPIEETMRALDDIVKSGKVRYIGNSNFAGWQVVEAAWVAKSEHLTPFVTAQNQYNLLERNIERELVPACRKYGLSICLTSPSPAAFSPASTARASLRPRAPALPAWAPWPRASSTRRTTTRS
jgi:aryl-alcohol dehydrogenase-like predicted oxidoreductase